MCISAVVCTKDRPELIGGCLDALARNRHENLEILIVDQSADDSTEKVVSRTDDSRVRHIRTDTIGLSRARNIGVESSSGEVIGFTDDDCFPAPDWSASIARRFESAPKISAVYGRSLPWGTVRPGERPVAVKADMKPRTFKGKHNPWRIGHGCNMAFRREVFGTVGLFDEALGPGGILRNCDDADFTYRLLRAGLAALYSPDVLVYHKQFRHGEELWRLEKDYCIGAGALYSKHLRCGDLYALKLVLDRWWSAGILHAAYGLLTGRAAHLRLGWYRVAYSALGMWTARTVRVSKTAHVFVENSSEG